jgi:cupin 2 domain-containing protein
LVEVLLRQGETRIERIVSRGHCSAQGFWYDQAEHEWVLLVTGAARLRFAESSTTVALAPGDHVHIAPHVRHRVDWTAPYQDTIWLAVFYR